MIELLPVVLIAGSVYVFARLVGFMEDSVKQERFRKDEEERKRRVDQLYGRRHM